jgi:hypothetical protein
MMGMPEVGFWRGLLVYKIGITNIWKNIFITTTTAMLYMLDAWCVDSFFDEVPNSTSHNYS